MVYRRFNARRRLEKRESVLRALGSHQRSALPCFPFCPSSPGFLRLIESTAIGEKSLQGEFSQSSRIYNFEKCTAKGVITKWYLLPTVANEERREMMPHNEL